MQTQRRAREVELLREYSDIAMQPKFDAGVHEPRTRGVVGRVMGRGLFE
jgi:hypothetical protein